MRNKIAAGNWKMNLMPSEGELLIRDVLKEKVELRYNQRVVFIPPFTHLFRLKQVMDELEVSETNYWLGAQNASHKLSGAHTGEVSVEMLKDIGVRCIVVGHSERRSLYHESSEDIKNKVDTILAANLACIFCCGEPLPVRDAEAHQEYVKKQIEESLFHLKGEGLSDKLIIAYEPIWAIGTGKTASAEQAEDMHAFIRSLLVEKWGEEVAQDISILYGGSVKPENAAELFASPNVDGGLVGGASLAADSFLGIVKSLED